MKKFFTIFLLTLSATVSAQWVRNDTINTLVSTQVSSAKSKQVVYTDNNDNIFVAWIENRNPGITTNQIYLQKLNALGERQFTNDILISNTAGTHDNLSICSDGANGIVLAWNVNSDVFMQKINETGVIQWATDGIAVSNLSSTETSPVLALLNNSEFVVVWRDSRNGTVDLYANKFSTSSGAKLWASDLSIVTEAFNQTNQVVLPNTLNGFYCVWEDQRNGNTTTEIYAHRINNDGTLATGWPTNGVEIINHSGAFQTLSPSAVLTSANEVIIAWTDNRVSTTNSQIYAQKINSSGVLQWATQGVAVCTAANNQSGVHLTTDDNNGAIATWSDLRAGNSDRNIYAQRILNDGSMSWVVDGVAICTETGNQPSVITSLQIVSDKSGGAIICWDDARFTTNNLNIYAQRISGTGTLRSLNGYSEWATTNGVPVAVRTANQRAPVLSQRNAPNEAATVVFLDSRTGLTNSSLYASALYLDGTLLSLKLNKLEAVLMDNGQVQIKWQVLNENNIVAYELEKSLNNKNFKKLNLITQVGKTYYTDFDPLPNMGDNYYRIKIIDNDGKIGYSQAIKLNLNHGSNFVKITPNPTTDFVNISLQNLRKGNYQILISDYTGKTVFSNNIQLNSAFATTVISTHGKLTDGLYLVTVLNDKGRKIQSMKLIKQ